MLDLVHRISAARDKEHAEAVLVASVDCSAAFDTVSHDILLRKLEQACGIEGPALALLRSYLQDRVQRTSMATGKSTWRRKTHAH